MSHILRGLLPVLVTAALLSGPILQGQGTHGSLTGTVTHEGLPLSGVSIAIASPALQGTRIATSNRFGDYKFHALPPGTYNVTIQMAGMQTLSRSVRVGLASTSQFDVALHPDAVAEVVTVTATDTEIVASDSVLTNLPSELIEILPVERSIQGAIDLAPGVTVNTGGQVVVSGAYSYDTLYLINGGVTSENMTGQTENLYIEDAIQEITVLSGAIPAEYGRFTGGVVSVITKSGGNEFSGSFRSSLTNPAWTAFGETNAESEWNSTYEVTLGGRIVRDRLWFFGAGRHIETTQLGFYMQSEEEVSDHSTDERYEIKLTGQLTPNHSLVGSFLSYEVEQSPYCPSGCWEVSAVDTDGRSASRELVVANYNGILTKNLLLEAGWSARDYGLVDDGGEHQTTDYTDPRDIALGTRVVDASYGGTWGAPFNCVPCADGRDDVRSNQNYNVKGTWYQTSNSLGTHAVVVGYENFAESRLNNVYESGSLFAVYSYSGIPPTRVGPPSQPGSLRPVISYGDVLFYAPIDAMSHGSDFVTESLFVNDKWDLNSKWSFNVGVRYDRNDGKDGQGHTISRDSNVGPRLGASWDVRGDGRLVVNASYSRYVSRIQEAVGGFNGGGAPSSFLYLYDGVTVGGLDSGLSSSHVLEQLFAWLLAQGWTSENRSGVSSFLQAYIPGMTTRLDGTLRSPYVDERTVGFAAPFGRSGFVRLDYIDKSWGDFYVASTTPGDVVFFEGRPNDILTITNCSNCLERSYEAVQVQAGHRFTDRLTAGGNYTWSESRGDTVGQVGFGQAAWDEILMYPEYNSFSRRQPIGFLGNDQTHKLRLWLGYDIPLGRLGSVNASLLQRLDSGRPYSAVANVNVRDYVACHPCGYATPPFWRQYFFSDRGAYRWDDTTATDLALNYELPLSNVSLFVQGELLNAFNEQAVVSGGTTVRRLAAFNPFTETPEEGKHWAKASTFGQPFGAGSYQQPRTYRFSLGLRF